MRIGRLKTYKKILEFYSVKDPWVDAEVGHFKHFEHCQNI